MTATIRLRPGDAQRMKRAIAAYGRQARFALAGTLNELARGVRDEVRAELPQVFTLRAPQSAAYARRSVQAGVGELRATKDRLTAAIAVDRLGANRSFLPSLTTGGINRTGPWGPVAVPTRALRSSPTAVIPRGLYPRALGLLAQRDAGGGILWSRTTTRSRKGRARRGAKIGPQLTRTGKTQVKGFARTFAIDPRFSRGNVSYGVFQRTGPRSIRKLFSYVDHAALPPRIPLAKISADVTRERFASTFARYLDKALKSAKP